jgi:heterodisulfide reductase subunit A-like polyferredoxin
MHMASAKGNGGNGQSGTATDLTGAVLVVGGGIGGIQASLDLAEAGYKVYLAEKKSAIGGHMAQLDKTFPTNDCAMCTISPKLVDVGRHLNIDVLTDTEVLSVDGEAGNFQAKLRHHPRYIDLDKCTACGDCEEVCPVEIQGRFEEGLLRQKAAHKLYPQATTKRRCGPSSSTTPFPQSAAASATTAAKTPATARSSTNPSTFGP